MKSRCTAFLGSWGVVEGLELGQLVRFGNFAGRPAPDVCLARTPPAHAGDGQHVAVLDTALSAS
jgi:hypothetical protein